jgi:hypothetical protein
MANLLFFLLRQTVTFVKLPVFTTAHLTQPLGFHAKAQNWIAQIFGR